MSNKKTYWLGEKIGSRRVGQISIAGQSYGIGESFPADKLDKKVLKRYRDGGCVGDAPFSMPDPKIDDAKDKDITLLQGKLSGLEDQAIKDGDTIAGLQLELEADGGSDSIKEIAELNKLIDEIKDGDVAEIADLKTDNEEKAALIKELKSEVKALKKELKK